MARFVAIGLCMLLACASTGLAQDNVPAQAPTETVDDAPIKTSLGESVWKTLFTDTARDLRRMPSRSTFDLISLGAIAAVGAHNFDNDVSRELSNSADVRRSAQTGAVLGSMPFQLSAALATMVVGRVADKPRAVHIGADLIRAQLFAEAIVIGIKQTARRDRPEGTGFSFPSGHTTVSFASATVLQRHLGWKIGLPAYATAGYIAVSRVQMRRHYLSDVAFGAALGIVAGRTITIGHAGPRLELVPHATPYGATLSFKWLGKQFLIPNS
jgi:membrane-associated phospholipid phosphatase